MRVTTAFNRLLALPGARVTDVSFEDGVVCEVALRRRRAACSSCGQVCRSIHDRSPRRWRHLDLAGQRLQIEYALRRVRCTDCGVHVEAVPWARPRARHTRDFDVLGVEGGAGARQVDVLAAELAGHRARGDGGVAVAVVGLVVGREGALELLRGDVGLRREGRGLERVVACTRSPPSPG